MATMTDAETFEFEDLQGLVRFGHGHLSDTRFLLLDVNDAEAARAWIGSAPVTTAATVRPLPDTALQVAFTAGGLRALGLSDEVVGGFSDEFLAGMSRDDSRSRRLGDVGRNDPEHWDWGGDEARTPQLLLLLYARPGGIPAWEGAVRGAEHFEKAFRLRAALPTANLGNREPFGFVDGISQPRIDWERRLSTDIHARDRYDNRVALGEVVLGYPNEYGLYTDRPLIDPHRDPAAHVLPGAEELPERRDLGRNGCYLVLRQLRQDAAEFWQFVDRAAGADPEKREQLAAAMVGRRRDGTPLARAASRPIGGVESGADSARLNQFTFDDDPDGYACPIGAHIRRSNPRTGDFPHPVTGLLSRLIQIFGFGRRHHRDDLVASTRFHRLVRRGRAYGTSPSPEAALTAVNEERGLEFICLVANISRQFEFVQHAWSMSPKFGGVRNETDPLLGNREPLLDGTPTDVFYMPRAEGPADCIRGLPQFVTVGGGAYFFMPGIRALRYLAGLGSTQGGGSS